MTRCPNKSPKHHLLPQQKLLPARPRPLKLLLPGSLHLKPLLLTCQLKVSPVKNHSSAITGTPPSRSA